MSRAAAQDEGGGATDGTKSEKVATMNKIVGYSPPATSSGTTVSKEWLGRS